MEKTNTKTIEILYKTAAAYTFFSLVVAQVSVDILLIARGLIKPSLNLAVIQALLPRPGIGLLADLAIGAMIGLVLNRLRERLINQKNGVLLGFAVLALVSLLITLGPAVGMRLPVTVVLRTLLIYLIRDLLAILVVVYWVRQPRKRWLDWTAGLLIALCILVPILLMVAGMILMNAFFGPP